MWSIFYFLLLYQPVVGPHFDGGSIRWIPISKNATISPIQILITQSYSYTLSLVTCTVGSLLNTANYGFNFSLWCTNNCGPSSAGYIAPTVLGYCTGSNSALNLAFVQRSDIVNLTANDYFTISYAIPSNSTQGYYRTLTLSNGTSLATAHWNITASIDIRPRPDNGLINTPPVASVISPYGIPYNITTQIVIPTMDVDGDDVRCRWGNSSAECGDVCFPGTTPVGTTLSSNCTLAITGTSTSGWYCASIQVEDFLSTSTSLTPMSSIPIQFLIYVYQPQNCLVPLLTSPSTCIGVQVGLPTTVTYTVINSCGSSSTISSIAIQSFSGIVQGPLVLITANGTVYEMNITYTPLASQVGPQILCAVATDNANIPSNQYCITFIVSSTTTPTCLRTTTMMYTTEMSTHAEVTSTEVATSSLTSPETFQTDVDETTSGSKIISTTTPSEFEANIWILIGSFIGAFFLLVLLGSCCLCYDCFWGSAARRRHRQRQQREEQYQFRHQPGRKMGADSTIISRPPKAYQIYKFDTNGPRYWNNNNERMFTKATPRNYSISTKKKTDASEIGGILQSN